MVKKNTAVKDDSSKEKAILSHLADYIIQSLIKEDVNAFAESGLLHELLVYKLSKIAYPLMSNVIDRVSDGAKDNTITSSFQKISGITKAKRIFFRSDDQYNAFVAVFFKVLDDHPEKMAFCRDEETFEKFMIVCIYEFREKIDEFVKEITQEKIDFEYKNRLYAARRYNEARNDIPSYADYIDERFEGILG